MRCWDESTARVSLRLDLRGDSQGHEGRCGADRFGHAGRRRRRCSRRIAWWRRRWRSRAEICARRAARVRAVLVNAGNANCATRTGERVAIECVAAAAKVIGAKPERGAAGVHRSDRRGDGWAADRQCAAETGRGIWTRRDSKTRRSAILTTDTARQDGVRGSEGREHRGDDQRVRHDSAAHGDDAGIRDDRRESYRRPCCARALKRAIDRSYNRISVDGDTSTNDTVAVLANGASGVKPSAKAFEAALTEVLESLARQIVARRRRRAETGDHRRGGRVERRGGGEDRARRSPIRRW